MRWWWSRPGALVALAVSAGVMACGPSGDVAIGVGLSRAFVDASRMAIADAAAEGGLPTVDTMLIAEANSRAAPALELAERFHRVAGMVAVVAHANSASSLATAPVYNQLGIVQVAPTSSAPSYDAAGPFSYRLVPSDAGQGVALARTLGSLLPRGGRVAVLYVNDDYGRGIRRAFLDQLDQGKFRVVHDQPHLDPGGSPAPEMLAGWRTAVASLASAEPEVLLWFGRAATLRFQLPMIRELLGPIPILGSDALSPWRQYDQGKGRWDGIRYTDFLDPEASDTMRGFLARYGERYGRPGGTAEILTYDATRLILAAIRDGARSGEAVRRWLDALGRERPPYQGLSGPIAFDTLGNVQRPFVLLTIDAPAR